MPLRPSDKQLRHLLTIVFVVAIVYEAGFSLAAIDAIRYGVTWAREPFQFGFRLNTISSNSSEALAAGVRYGDVLEELDGRPFTGAAVLHEVLERKRAGDPLHVVVKRPNASRIARDIRLAPIRPIPATLAAWLISIAIEIVLPVFCLALGFRVASARPYDRNAWLLLALLISFSQIVEGFSWEWPFRSVAFVWNAAMGRSFGAWLIWLFLFALYFPERAEFDRRLPWLKWILLAPLMVQAALFFIIALGQEYSFAALSPLAPVLFFLSRVPVATYLGFVAIGAFFALIWIKGAHARTSDARRRLRMLYFGTAVSLTPLFITAVISLIARSDPFHGLPEWALIVTLLFLLLFPLTLAYVIVVQRAMEIDVVLRQGAKYALARGGLLILRFALLGFAIWALIAAFMNHRWGFAARCLAILFFVVVVTTRRKMFDRLFNWIDRRFFREAYSAELVMSELAGQAQRFTEPQSLLSTVAHRVSETLHVSRMAVFLRENDRFCVTQTIGFDPPPETCLSPRGASVGLLSEAKKPELVYFDDPRSWVHDAPPDEQLKLRSLNAEVLLALPGRTELLGLIALGPKLSEQPYSPADLRLLQSVAVQTGLALENTQLLAAVAHEAGQRERHNRDMEIAREVQERLFPQSCPRVSGLDYFGFCRPALAVGGDYYDYITRPDGRIGIALGDVSGKGISAALMMASLQSLLRGQFAAGLDDVSALLTNTNRLIYEVSTANRYVTFFYGEYDPATRRLVYVNAGHNAPIILRGAEVIRLEACGPVIGLLRGIEYQSAVFQFKPNDTMILFTDGISEAMTGDNEEWGDDRLIEAARACRGQDATQMTTFIMAAADAFTAGAEQHDDMTLIALRAL